MAKVVKRPIIQSDSEDSDFDGRDQVDYSVVCFLSLESN